MGKFYLLMKDGKRYKTQSKWLAEVCSKFKGYESQGVTWWSDGGREALPFRLTKEEREKYKVVMRLTK